MTEIDCLLSDVYAHFQQGLFYDEDGYKVFLKIVFKFEISKIYNFAVNFFYVFFCIA